MKKTVVLFFLLGIMLTGFSQVKLDYNAKPKSEAKGFSTKGLSASSAHFLYQLRQVESATDRSLKESLYAQLQKDYNITQGKVSAIIVLAAGQTPQNLATYGVTVGTVSGEMFTAMIPVDRFVELAESGICATIDMGEKQNLMMDNARENLGIDQIHAGMHLPQGYDGSGVVVGIIDGGFEYCHPTFYDATGTTSRVKRVWNHSDNTGTAPAGYDYGSEYTTLSQMMAAETDDTSATHGSHVASIAAGCGAPSGDGANYKGIAKGADIVLVPAIMDNPHILDAIQYIYSYAQSVSKPCVINMSFGSMVGPHDGTSYEDRFLTSFIAQHPDSIVLVASAGNSGSTPVHLEKQFSAEDTLLNTRLVYDFMQNKNGVVDVWGDKNYSVALTLVSATTNQQVDFTGFFTTGIDTSYVVNLLTNDNDTLTCQFYLSSIDSINHRYDAFIRFGTIPSYHQLILTVRCDTTATIHAWCNRISFNETSLVDGTVSGDSYYTIAGFGTNSDAVISVGAYATRLGYTTYEGNYHSGSSAQEMGDIAYFSSVGPTFDGRVKPDIAAPGSVIAAACNRFDPMETIYDTIVWNGQIEKYTPLQGTSMSSPMVTGIVALWMQHNPSLGTDSVRAILHGTAHNDRFTGNCVTTPNNIWGHGKVNAFGGLPTDTTLWLLNAFDAVDGTGCVDGGGVVTEGVHTLTPIPATNYLFVSWEDGNTDNPRTVNVTCDTTFIAVFAPFDYEDCDTIVDFPWTAEFDENLTCWKLIDADGDGEIWEKLPASVSSMVVGLGVAHTDNWFISPAIEVNQNLNLKVATHAINSNGSQDCTLLLSTSGSEMSDFTTELDNYTYTAIEDKEFLVSLADFQGQIVRVAVRHHNCVGMLAALMLNDFTIEIAQDSVLVPTYAETSNYTVATQGLQLNISGAEGRALQIYDLTGRLIVNKPNADGYYRMPSSGVYILRVDGFKPRKVMVVQ